MFGGQRAGNHVVDDVDDLRGTSLYVERELSEGLRSIVLRLRGSGGRVLSSARLTDALPHSGDWFFVLNISSSPNDSWQVRLEV